MCIRCPLLRWKNAELTQLRGSKVGDGDGVWMRDIYWGWVRATKKKEGLERRRWTSCQLDNLHQPSKGSGPTWPVCIIWEGLTCSLLLLPHVGICEKVCTLGKMDFSRSGACRSGGSWNCTLLTSSQRTLVLTLPALGPRIEQQSVVPLRLCLWAFPVHQGCL